MVDEVTVGLAVVMVVSVIGGSILTWSKWCREDVAGFLWLFAAASFIILVMHQLI